VGGEEAERVTQHRVVLGLGANLGDRGGTIARAIEVIATWPDVTLVSQSPLYVTPPAGGPPQPDYWNGAVLILTSNDLRSLLDRMLDLERSLGRIRPDPVRWGPRTIDIDMLWVEGLVLDEPGLSVPHPRLGERVFALRPLLDVAPDARDPRTNEPYAAFVAAKLPIDRAC
jgi:2-amino-4-hydroxy-6-hydroxymethyldihydropteridine diphosphokinase